MDDADELLRRTDVLARVFVAVLERLGHSASDAEVQEAIAVTLNKREDGA